MFLLFTLTQLAASSIRLSGYLCPTCPSVTDPAELLHSLHSAYSVVNVAFAGFDASGRATNLFDTTAWNLSKVDVAQLQSAGRTVMLSVGGGDGAVLSCASPMPAFAAELSSSLLEMVKQYGFDGIDWDVEHRSGDFAQCGVILTTTMEMLRAAMPSIKLSIAPQMTNIDPDVAAISAGFNELAPVISGRGLELLDFVQPQMYNTWGAVENTAYAQAYVAKLVAGFTTAGAAGASYATKVPPAKLLLGYPSTPKGAATGFIAATAVAAMIANMSSHGLSIGGVMVWSIGWDAQAGYPFATAMASAPTPPPPPAPTPAPPGPSPPGPSPPGKCRSLSPSVTDAWCETNCHHAPPNCPAALCACAPSTRAENDTSRLQRSSAPRVDPSSYARNLTLLSPADAPLARCMDGTPGGYYFHAGTNKTRWVFTLQGGGECVSSAECATKVDTALGSSAHFPSQYKFFEEDVAHFSDADCFANPVLCEYNQVFVPYCSQDLWSGTRTAADRDATFGYFFAGHHILDAVLAALEDAHSLGDAEAIVFSGLSAGGFGVYKCVALSRVALRLATRRLTAALPPPTSHALQQHRLAR